MDIKTIFNLTDKEQAIYLTALELGESLQLPLAQKASLKRTTLRELLPNLLNRGFLEETVKGKRRYIVARDPRELAAAIEEKARQAKKLIPSLMGIQNSLSHKAQVFFYDGVEGIKQVYEQTLMAGQSIYSFVDIESIHPEIQKWLTNDYAKRRKQKKIKAFNIVNASEKLFSVMPVDEFRENKLVSAKDFPFQTEILIFGDSIGLIHFRKTDLPSAILIRSQAAAITLRSIHQLFWR